MMLVTNARLRDREGRWDIDVDSGTIASITPANAAEKPEASGRDVFDANGRLVSPQFAESHIHLDYANTAGKPRINQSGTLFEA
ncbi:MAG: hypothetical protein WBV82_20575, partial [Myxococcaceae bacterium]